MRDEVLQKALASDATVIPRYDVVLPDGTKVAENVQLVLKNTVLTAGTPLNKQSLLKDSTAIAYSVSALTGVPDDVLVAIRRSTSYCTKLKITGVPNSLAYVQKTSDAVPAFYTVDASGEVTVDILSYGTYKIWGNLQGVVTPTVAIDIDSTKLYEVDINTFVTYCKVTVEEEVGATITARHSDGTTVTGMVKADKTCTLALRKTGNWSISGRIDACDSSVATLAVTDVMHGVTTDKSLFWTKLHVNIDAGSNIVASYMGNSRSGVSNTEYMCTIWLPSAGNWTVTATLGDKTATATAYSQQYESYNVSLRYA